MHPGRNDLRLLLRGELEEGRAIECLAHLENCGACEETMVGLEAESGTWIVPRTEVADLPDYAREAACRRAVTLVDRIADTSGGREGESGNLPRRLGHYLLLEQIAVGGMGVVYRARHQKLGRIVAIKVLPHQRLRDDEAVARFEREMLAVGRLDHPHLVRALDAGEDGGVPFLVMEFLEGRTLAELAERWGPLPIAEACELIRQAALGLQEAHEHGLVHRDIKPSNLMLARSRQGGPVVKVLDLGLASFTDPQAPVSEVITSAGQTLGTLDYMAPEQCGSGLPVDARADLYALGATLYRLLAGDAVYSGKDYPTLVQKLTALATRPAAPISERRADVPRPLAAVLQRMLAKNPEQRPATPRAVAESLARFCRGADLERLLAATSPVPVAAASCRDATSGAGVATTRATGPATSANGRRKARSIAGGILAGLLPLLLLACAPLFLQTPRGTLRIQINDPSLEVQIKAHDQLVVKNVDGEDLRLQVGQYALLVTRGDFSFETERLVVKKGGRTTIQVDLLPGEIQVVQNGQLLDSRRLDRGDGVPPKPPAGDARPAAMQVAPPVSPPLSPPASPPLTSPAGPGPSETAGSERDRSFATWPDAPGLILTVEVGGEPRTLTYRQGTMPALPAEPFQVVGVAFHTHLGQAASEADVQRLVSSGLPQLRSVGFQYQDVAPRWLDALHETLPGIRKFEFNAGAEHLPSIGRFQHLESVQIARQCDEWIEMLSTKPIRTLFFQSDLSVESCERLATFPELSSLRLANGTITDERLAALSRSKSLVRLEFSVPEHGWRATGEGLAHLSRLEWLSFGRRELPRGVEVQTLKQRLPHCRVEYFEGGQKHVLEAAPRPQ